ncbi:Uncharacterised protein [Legionella busanensis]|uniref:Uncharacterized protein n=1 Tax=Legionella busanensis TaxID=190655 RepID=A0A378JMC7_9GAMM|nr:hypothetical protein [Legionella busanensis]STX51453.1 Uncharacterised protein [Legionella busanensis]
MQIAKNTNLELTQRRNKLSYIYSKENQTIQNPDEFIETLQAFIEEFKKILINLKKLHSMKSKIKRC